MTLVRILRKRALPALFLLLLFTPFSVGQAIPRFQEPTPDPQAQAFLERLSPEERVGQLFLVTFNGTDISPESQIYDLIINGHIGGVVLQAENDNFVAAPDTVDAAWEMNRALQMADWQGAQQDQTNPNTGETFRPVFVPLFIGISQEGGGYPNDQILNGLTQLPSAMAIGATWQPELARQVGNVLGSELSALGFNMLLGPSLDVLSDPKPESGVIGTRSFGGDPYWVGQVGSSYVAGVHEGSQSRIAVVATHFPGLGGADRPPDEEIPTVRKSLTQLTQIELAPFFAVTGEALSPERVVDGLLVSPIYYQGFQGNIRATTRPVVFDPQAFGELMGLEQFAGWRANGGLTVSDELGTRAVRIFRDPTEQTFNARLVANDAFLAGNDLLFLSNFADNNDPDSYTTILRTLEFFTQKYREDVAFAQRVDAAALRIITKKYDLYGSFTLGSVLPDEEERDNLSPDDQITFEVSRQAATLLNPAPAELDNVVPIPPGLFSQIVFFTDSRTVTQCGECPKQTLIPTNALQLAVDRFYGPDAGGQVLRENLYSSTFDDLLELLDTGEQPNALQTQIANAEWLVFNLLDVTSEHPSSFALRRFLAERPDLIQDKTIVVFAYNAPYFLDATEISKVTVYYSLYSKGQAFINVAARLLFRELAAPGASPVSVPGLGYVLIDVTSPDPEQIIPMILSVNEAAEEVVTATPETETLPEVQVGDRIFLRTGTIVDQNGHQVPDGTPVRFVLTSSIEGTTQQRESFANTANGVAQTTFLLENSGTVEIRAESGQPVPAQSESLQVEVASGEGEAVATLTEEITEEPSPIPEATQPGEGQEQLLPRTTTNVVDWILNFLVTGFVALFAYQVGATAGLVRWGIRWALAAMIGGLFVNTYLAFELPGSVWLVSTWGVWGVAFSAIIGAGLGWALGGVWRLIVRDDQEE